MLKMTCIFRTLRKYWSSLRSHWKLQRVSFSPSTLSTDRERTLRKIASPIPFQNFVNDVRLTSLQDMGRDKMSLRESLKLRKSAVRLWPGLSEERKNKYRKMADNWRATRLPMENIPKSVANLSVPQSNNPEVMLDAPAPAAMTEGRCRPRRSCRKQPVKRRTRSRSASRKRSRSVPRKRRVKKPPEIIAPTERTKRLRRKRRMDAEERRSSEIFVSLSKCISRVDLQSQQVGEEPETPKDQENSAPDLSTHRLTKHKRVTRNS